MKSPDWNKRIETLKRRRKIIDKQIELAELMRDDQHASEKQQVPHTDPKPQVD